MAKIAPISIPEATSTEPKIDANRKSERRDSHSSHNRGRASVTNAVVNEWRFFMTRAGWYDSSVAIGTRKFLRGRLFAVLAMIALFVALFISDLFVMFHVEENTVLNVILVIVLIIFAYEFFGLAATDASYLFSFFFWMDFLGTISLIFDITFFLGTDATQPEKHSGAGAEENIIVVRAARATKLGARAGRLSRVMKLLRFLPFVSGSAQESGVKMARVISGQLTNVLSTRVAFLTICIVVVLPIFGMFTYPEVDDSMASWTELMSVSATELFNEYLKAPFNSTEIGLSTARLTRELNEFASFYKNHNYGPFASCYGEMSDKCACSSSPNVSFDFDSSFKKPGRANFIRIVSHRSFTACFDLSTPRQLEAIANVSLIVFIIVVMCVFGLATSNSITVIALHPLERMLSVVRQRCKQIFKYTDVLEEDDSDNEDDEEYDDADHVSEFALLEMVVGKLAAIAHLSTTKDEPEVKEGMTEDEKMTLNWMQGTHVAVAKKRMSTVQGDINLDAAESSTHVVASNSLVDNVPRDILDAVDTHDLSTIDLSKDHMLPLAAHILLTSEGCANWVHQNVKETHVVKFVEVCESKYKDNPFHNFAHALDVEYTASRHMTLIEADSFLPETSQYWLLVAAIGHDLGHTGVNNQYLVETSHELALRYNDRSPLENMHCATLFQVTSDPEANVFASVEKDVYKEMRKGIIYAILHTDVTKHNEMMKELTLLYQMNSEAFDAQKLAGGTSEQVIEVLEGHSQLTLNAILHGSDVGNPMKPWELAHRLAYLCVDEFFAQGDQEKALGIPVQMLNDRDKVNRPNSQIGFIEFVIAPMVEEIVHLFPTLDFLAENLGNNIENWFDVWVDQVSPNPEVKAKTQARVQKVYNRCATVMRPEQSEGGRQMSTHD